jgi:hypothetical protein
MVESMSNETSQSYDAVLGGDRPAPFGGLVLGGLVGLQQQFETKDITAQMAALINAVDFGDGAISLLLQGLDSEVLQIRCVAYNLLKQIGSSAAIEAAGEGIPLRVGDRIYGVYRSTIIDDDYWYSIHASIDEDFYHEGFPLYRSATDNKGASFFYITDDREENQRDIYDEYYYPELLTFYLMEVDAERKVEEKYKQIFLNMSVRFDEIKRQWDDFENDNVDDLNDDAYANTDSRNFDVAAWCDCHGVEFAFEKQEAVWEAKNRLLKLLYRDKKVDLLYNIWPQLGFKPLAFVHEYVIDRPCYLGSTGSPVVATRYGSSRT